MIACGCCGSGIDSPHIGGIWLDGEHALCGHCQAVNVVTVDDEDGYAYSMAWRCVHGRGDDEACDECEIESGIAV